MKIQPAFTLRMLGESHTRTKRTINSLTAGIRVRLRPRHMLSLRFLTSGIVRESVGKQNKQQIKCFMRVVTYGLHVMFMS